MCLQKTWQNDYPLFWFKNLSLDEKYNIVVIVFSFDFEGKMNYLVPLCVHERKCA